MIKLSKNRILKTAVIRLLSVFPVLLASLTGHVRTTTGILLVGSLGKFTRSRGAFKAREQRSPALAIRKATTRPMPSVVPVTGERFLPRLLFVDTDHTLAKRCQKQLGPLKFKCLVQRANPMVKS